MFKASSVKIVLIVAVGSIALGCCKSIKMGAIIRDPIGFECVKKRKK